VKWYFLICLVAALIVVVLWSSIIVFAILHHRLTVRNYVGLIAPLAFFLWGAREMYRAWREIFQTDPLPNVLVSSFGHSWKSLCRLAVLLLCAAFAFVRLNSNDDDSSALRRNRAEQATMPHLRNLCGDIAH
jgi:hypothetical protein